MGGDVLPQVSPWYSVKAKVYHNNDSCKTGNNIEKENMRSGKGTDKRLCWECAKLNKGGD